MLHLFHKKYTNKCVLCRDRERERGDEREWGDIERERFWSTEKGEKP